MFGVVNVIEGFGRVLHDVEAIEHDLVGGRRQGFQSGLHIRLPHFHRHNLHRGKRFQRQRVENSRQLAVVRPSETCFMVPQLTVT